MIKVFNDLKVNVSRIGYIRRFVVLYVVYGISYFFCYCDVNYDKENIRKESLCGLRV